MSIEAMKAAAEALHRIASSNQAKRILAKPGKVPAVILESMRAKVMSEEDVDRLALDTFETLIIAMKDAGASDAVVHECSAEDMSPEHTTTIHPWGVYLHHRARVLDYFRRDGQTPEQIVETLRMDPDQVRLILMTVDDYPEDYAVTSPVPIPGAKRLRSSHDPKRGGP